MDGGDGSTILWMHLMPMTLTLQNGYDGKFYRVSILLPMRSEGGCVLFQDQVIFKQR